MVLGASSDPVSADWPRAKPRGSTHRRAEDHRDQDERADQKPSHVFRTSSSALWLEHRRFATTLGLELHRNDQALRSTNLRTQQQQNRRGA